MNVLKESELAAEYSRPIERLTQPFKPVRRLVAAATDILRRKKNVFIVGGMDGEKLSPTITSEDGEEIPNPNFSPEECFKLTRPTAEVIVLLTCSEETLIDCMGNPDLLDREVGKLLISATDTEIISQVPIVFEAIQGIGASTVQVDSEEADSLNPEKKTQQPRIGWPHG